MEPTTPTRRLSLDLTEEEWGLLKEAKLLSGARTYIQVMTEALRRHCNVERERVLRMKELLKDKP